MPKKQSISQNLIFDGKDTNFVCCLLPLAFAYYLTKFSFFFTQPLIILKKYYFCIGFVFGKFRGGKSRREVWKLLIIKNIGGLLC
jgi:hypothetical protein